MPITDTSIQKSFKKEKNRRIHQHVHCDVFKARDGTSEMIRKRVAAHIYVLILIFNQDYASFYVQYVDSRLLTVKSRRACFLIYVRYDVIHI